MSDSQTTAGGKPADDLQENDHPRGTVTDEAEAGPQVTETAEFSEQDPFILGTFPFREENGQLL